MKEVVSVRVMRESDENEIKNGKSGLELMRLAGEGLFKVCEKRGRAAIVCGTGNNAGDGYVLASRLKSNCHLFLLENKFSECGKFYFDKCIEEGVTYSFIDENLSFDGFDTIVDCIFGTGFKGEAKGEAKKVIDKINESGKLVISCDIPSGLNGDTGKGYSVISDITLSIGTIKTGLILNEAKDKIKLLLSYPIGIDIVGEKYYLLEKEDFYGMIDKRKHYSHKGTYGYTGIWGGCEEYSGAVKLSNLSLSSLRAGCGVSRLIVEESVAPMIGKYLLESTLCKVGKAFSKEETDRALSGLKALAIGMGWGKNKTHEKVLGYILENYDISLIIDADGINCLSGMDVDILKKTKCRVCLTPHLKEFSRLSGLGVEEIDTVAAKEFAKKYGVVLLLKGTATTITDGDEVYFVNSGAPGMATAGSGDVLSGILAGLMGYMDLNARSVALGAYIAGRAGEIAQQNENAVSMTAWNTIRAIGEAVGEIYEN